MYPYKKVLSNFNTRRYHVLEASQRPYAAFCNIHRLLELASPGDLIYQYLSLSIQYPRRKAHFMSIDSISNPQVTTIEKNTCTLSLTHAGLSDLIIYPSFSSKPLATSGALVDITPYITFGVITQRVEIVF